MFLQAIFSHTRTFQQHNFICTLNYTKFTIQREIKRVICTGVTLFALVLHVNYTALSQSESSNFLMCIIIKDNL